MTSDLELIKCTKCNWVHFIVEDGEGIDNCFFCSSSASKMIQANESDCPLGCTVQGINISSYGRKKEGTIAEEAEGKFFEWQEKMEEENENN